MRNLGSRRVFLQWAASAAALGLTFGGDDEALAATGRAPAHFVLVHGAWHGAWCWYKLRMILELAGHRVTAIDLPSHGADGTPPSTVTLQSYSDKLTSFLDAQSAPVVLVGHSMGGVAISAAAEARPEKISRLVYLAAFLLQSGQSLLDIALADSDSLVTSNIVPKPELGVVDINREAVPEAFYNESSSFDISLASSRLKVNPIAPLGTPLALTDARFGSVRRFYISCLRDQAVTPAAQAWMYQALPCERVVALDTDHSPFFSQPLRLASELVQIANA